MNKIREEFTEMIINTLQGTCISDYEVVDYCIKYGTDEERVKFKGMEFDDCDLQTLDDSIFLCCQCGWWCDGGDQHEHANNIICGDCKRENEEDE